MINAQEARQITQEAWEKRTKQALEKAQEVYANDLIRIDQEVRVASSSLCNTVDVEVTQKWDTDGNPAPLVDLCVLLESRYGYRACPIFKSTGTADAISISW